MLIRASHTRRGTEGEREGVFLLNPSDGSEGGRRRSR